VLRSVGGRKRGRSRNAYSQAARLRVHPGTQLGSDSLPVRSAVTLQGPCWSVALFFLTSRRGKAVEVAYALRSAKARRRYPPYPATAGVRRHVEYPVAWGSCSTPVFSSAGRSDRRNRGRPAWAAYSSQGGAFKAKGPGGRQAVKPLGALGLRGGGKQSSGRSTVRAGRPYGGRHALRPHRACVRGGPRPVISPNGL